MKITEIEIDDSQTGQYWVQIYARNQKQAFSLKNQILEDQAIRERLKIEIKKSQSIISQSSSKWEMAEQNFLLHKLLYVLEGKS